MKNRNIYIGGVVSGIVFTLSILVTCLLFPYLLAALLLSMNVKYEQVILTAIACSLFAGAGLLFFSLPALRNFTNFIKRRLTLERCNRLRDEDSLEFLGWITGIVIVLNIFRFLPKLS